MSTVSDDRRRADEVRAAQLAEMTRLRHQAEEAVRAGAWQSAGAQQLLHEEAVFRDATQRLPGDAAALDDAALDRAVVGAAVQAALDDGRPQSVERPVASDEPRGEEPAGAPADVPSRASPPVLSSSRRAASAAAPAPARGAPAPQAAPRRAPAIASRAAAVPAPPAASVPARSPAHESVRPSADERPAVVVATSRPLEPPVPRRVQSPLPLPLPLPMPTPTPTPTPARPVDRAVASDFEAGWREARAALRDEPHAVAPTGDGGSSAHELFEQGMREGAAMTRPPAPAAVPAPVPARQAPAPGAGPHPPPPPLPSPARPAALAAPTAPGREPQLPRSTPPMQAPPAPSPARAPASAAVPIATLQQMLEPRPVSAHEPGAAPATAARPGPLSQASFDFWHACAQALPPGHELRGPLEQALQAPRGDALPAADAEAVAAPPSPLRDDDEQGARHLDAGETLEAARQALDAHLALLTPALQLAKAS